MSLAIPLYEGDGYIHGRPAPQAAAPAVRKADQAATSVDRPARPVEPSLSAFEAEFQGRAMRRQVIGEWYRSLFA